VLEPPPPRPLGCSPSWRPTPSWRWRPPSTQSVTAAMQLGPGMPAVKQRRTRSAMPRARVTDVSAVPGSKPSILRTTPVASPAPQQTPWIGSEPKQSEGKVIGGFVEN
jgi:hypothetical protein